MRPFIPACRGAMCMLLCCAAIASSAFAAAYAQPPLTLDQLEQQIKTSPELRAKELAVQAAIDGVREARDRSGLEYDYQNQIGPAAIIVPYSIDDHVLRYQQAVGIQLPLLGSQTTKVLSILTAEKDQQIALIATSTAYREKLSQLRSAYVNYWTASRQLDAARSYLATANDERPQALSLVRRGFWTQTEFLDYANTVSEVQARATEAGEEMSAQLAALAAALGRSVDRFEPAPPTFFANCAPDRSAAIDSAEAVDAQLAQLSAEDTALSVELTRVRGSSIQASWSTSAGSQTDINHRVSGYDLVTGIDVSLPSHARDDERALRAQYEAETQEVALEREQRKAEIVSTIDAAISKIAAARAALEQAQATQSARERDVEVAIAKLNTLKQPPEEAFATVHAGIDERYASERAAISAESDLLLQANALLQSAPAACGGSYEAIPPFSPAFKIKAPSQKNTAGSP